MAGFSGKFDSTRQDWTTPDDVFNPLNEEFNFTLDAAADANNARAPSYFTAQDDGLSQSWGTHTVWLNPPYGQKNGSLKDWVKKSYEESKTGATVVMLIPARTNTTWFHDICLAHAEVRFIKGRPKFGDATHGLPQPLCLVIFGKKKKKNIVTCVDYDDYDFHVNYVVQDQIVSIILKMLYTDLAFVGYPNEFSPVSKNEILTNKVKMSKEHFEVYMFSIVIEHVSRHQIKDVFDNRRDEFNKIALDSNLLDATLLDEGTPYFIDEDSYSNKISLEVKIA